MSVRTRKAVTKSSSSASQFKVPFLFENPLVSEVWKLPALCDLFNQPETRVVLADQCRFGTPWRHRTRFLVYAIADEDIHRLRHLCQAVSSKRWSLLVFVCALIAGILAFAGIGTAYKPNDCLFIYVSGLCIDSSMAYLFGAIPPATVMNFRFR